MRCRSLLQRRVFVATNLQPLYDLCKFSAKNIATIFHKQKRLRKPQPIHMSKLIWFPKTILPGRTTGTNPWRDRWRWLRVSTWFFFHPPTVIGTAGNQFRSAGEGNPVKRGYTRHWMNQLSSILCFVCTTGMRLFVAGIRFELMTCGLWARRANQLRYPTISTVFTATFKKNRTWTLWTWNKTGSV